MADFHHWIILYLPDSSFNRDSVKTDQLNMIETFNKNNKMKRPKKLRKKETADRLGVNEES